MWKKNVTPISKKDKEENTGATGWPALPQSLEQILLKPFPDVKDRKMTGGSQHGFLKGKSFLGMLIALYDNSKGFMNKGRAVYIPTLAGLLALSLTTWNFWNKLDKWAWKTD